MCVYVLLIYPSVSAKYNISHSLVAEQASKRAGNSRTPITKAMFIEGKTFSQKRELEQVVFWQSDCKKDSAFEILKQPGQAYCAYCVLSYEKKRLST